jgi:hypothetical protein
MDSVALLTRRLWYSFNAGHIIEEKYNFVFWYQILGTGWTVRRSTAVGDEIFRTGPGTHSASNTMGTGSLTQDPGRSVTHPHLSSAKVKERVELCLYSPSGPSWPVPGQNSSLSSFDSKFELKTIVCARNVEFLIVGPVTHSVKHQACAITLKGSPFFWQSIPYLCVSYNSVNKQQLFPWLALTY